MLKLSLTFISSLFFHSLPWLRLHWIPKTWSVCEPGNLGEIFHPDSPDPTRPARRGSCQTPRSRWGQHGGGGRGWTGFSGVQLCGTFWRESECSLLSFRFKKLQRPKLIWLAYQPANIEAVYHHKSMGPCPVEIRARCKGVLRWLVTISKCQNINFCVQSMLPARFTANFKESVLTIVFGIETEEA